MFWRNFTDYRMVHIFNNINSLEASDAVILVNLYMDLIKLPHVAYRQYRPNFPYSGVKTFRISRERQKCAMRNLS